MALILVCFGAVLKKCLVMEGGFGIMVDSGNNASTLFFFQVIDESGKF